MATPHFTITRDEETGLATVTVIFGDGSTLTNASTSANYEAVVKAVAIDNLDEEAVRDLMRPHLSVGRSLRALSPRVRYDEGNIYFDGDAIDNALARHIVRIIEEGGDENKYRALVNFMEKLYTNPSKASIESLYEFLVRQNFTILPDGDFIAYKGLNRDGTSRNSGYGIVDGVAFQSAHLPNGIGSVVEIPRSMVDADSRVGCSTGLHAGSYNYASRFANGLLVTVQINPRDVVSVPDDADYQKIRTARYVVLSQTEVEITTTTYATEDDEYDEEDGEGEDAFNDVQTALDNLRDDTGWDRDFDDDPLTVSEARLLREAVNADLHLNDAEYDALLEFEDSQAEAQAPRQRPAIAKVTPEEVKPQDTQFTIKLGGETEFRSERPATDVFATQIRNEIAAGEPVTLDFDYVNRFEADSSVEGYTPSEVIETAGDVLIKGQHTDGQWRSYYYSRMDNITVRVPEQEA